MREAKEKVDLTPLTPKTALDYLKFQDEYEGRRFSPIREDILEKGFNEQELCDKINILREEQINFSTIEGRKAFDEVFNKIFRSKIKNKQNLNKENFKSLVGTLMHAVNKTKKLTNNGQRSMFDALTAKKEERKLNNEKKEVKLQKRMDKKEEAQQKEINKVEQEIIVDSTLNEIFSSIKFEKMNEKPIGEKLMREELDDIFIQAWDKFLKEKPGLSPKKLKEIKNKFYTNNVY